VVAVPQETPVVDRAAWRDGEKFFGGGDGRSRLRPVLEGRGGWLLPLGGACSAWR
jgi:hypothetical protein